MMDPGRTLQDFRLLNKLTQKDIADFMNVHPVTVSCWERGATKISVEYFEKIMDYMGYEIVIREKRDSKKIPEQLTCSFTDCNNFKNPDYAKCIECKQKLNRRIVDE